MMVIHTCEQGSSDWFKVRAGIPTASMFATVMAKGRDGGASLTRKTYLMKLAGEIVTGEPMDSYSNADMERGRAMEEEAREMYAFRHEAEPELVGFIVNGSKGCSPDALVGSTGLLEIKTKAPHLLIECILRDDFPPGHKAQCQGALWVAEREWIDLAIYYPKMPLVVYRATRDEVFLAQLSDAVDRFNDELAAMVEKVRAYGQPKIEVAA